jgi:hypothetical protein
VCKQGGGRGVSSRSAWQRATLSCRTRSVVPLARPNAPAQAVAGRPRKERSAASHPPAGGPGAAPPRSGRDCPPCRPGASALGSAERGWISSQGSGWSLIRRTAANRAAQGEEPRRGKKKVRWKVRGSLGKAAGIGVPRAPLWSVRKEAVAGHPAHISLLLLHRLSFPGKVSLSLQSGLGGITPRQKVRVDGLSEISSLYPPVSQKGNLRHMAKQWPR